MIVGHPAKSNLITPKVKENVRADVREMKFLMIQ
jgi:hypothetical protein